MGKRPPPTGLNGNGPDTKSEMLNEGTRALADRRRAPARGGCPPAQSALGRLDRAGRVRLALVALWTRSIVFWMLELTHVNPNWFGALSVALVRRNGEPERRHGPDPWQQRGHAPRSRRVTDDLAWLRVALCDPSRTACTRFPTGGRSRPGCPTTTRSNGCGGSVTAPSSRPPASASSNTKPPTPDKQRKIATSGMGSARPRGWLLASEQGPGHAAVDYDPAQSSAGREMPLRTRSERLEAASTRARLGRWLSHKYAIAGLTRDGGTARPDLHPFRRRSPTEQRLSGRMVTVVPRLIDAPDSRGFCATATVLCGHVVGGASDDRLRARESATSPGSSVDETR
jgi:hypothetical protein